jgi:bile acid:Na+ symporter, BASS family
MVWGIIHIDILINLVLALITFSLGLTLTKRDFHNIMLNPKALTVGLLSQIIVLPLVVWGLLFFYPFSPETKVGFIIIAICPGGVTSNLVSFLLKGNVALSISLTVINSIITLLTIPFLTNIALSYYLGETSTFGLPYFHTMISIFLVTILPATIGVMVRAKFKGFAKAIKPFLKYLLPVLLTLIFAIKIFGDAEDGGTELTNEQFFDLAPAGLVMNATTILLGFLIGTIFLVKFKNRITIMIEVGLQNTALALLIAGVLIKNPEMEKPALVYAIITFLSTFLISYGVKWLFFNFKMSNIRRVTKKDK